MKLIIEEHDIGLEIDLTKVIEATTQRTGYQAVEPSTYLPSTDVKGLQKEIDTKMKTWEKAVKENTPRKKPGPKPGFKKKMKLKPGAVFSTKEGPVEYPGAPEDTQ